MIFDLGIALQLIIITFYLYLNEDKDDTIKNIRKYDDGIICSLKQELDKTKEFYYEERKRYENEILLLKYEILELKKIK